MSTSKMRGRGSQLKTALPNNTLKKCGVLFRGPLRNEDKLCLDSRGNSSSCFTIIHPHFYTRSPQSWQNFTFGRFRVQMSARRQAILTEV
jgi:hypothetical protein